MIKTELIDVKEEKPTSFVCDRCEIEMIDDTIQRQEALSWSAWGGYGSVFGDGAKIEIDLCQSCVEHLLGSYIRVT